MSNQEGDRDSLGSQILQLQQHQQLLQQHQQLLAKYTALIKHQLDSLTEHFNNRPEVQEIATLQVTLAQWQQQLSEKSVPPEASEDVANCQTLVSAGKDEIQLQPIQSQSSLVFERSGSRSVLLEVLEKAQQRLIIVCPWLNRNSIDADLMQKFRDCLNRNCQINIGWGYLSDRARIGIGWRYNALEDLRQLERDYPEYFKLKLLGTDEKFLVCDRTFAMLGSHNLLTSSVQSAEREVGIRTTDPQIIQGLINRFDGAELQKAQAINESLEDSVNLDDAESIEAPDIGIDDSAEDSQQSAISGEEFLQRYDAGERDFTGINLTEADLTGASLSGVNFSKAKLIRAILCNANLGGANLSEANLSYANLSGANMHGAEISAANLSSAKLVGTNLNVAALIQANLDRVNLSNADLSYANFASASLRWANLTGADLEGTNLAAANLSESILRKVRFSDKTRLRGANLNQVNFLGADLQKFNLSRVNLSKANFYGALLCFSNLREANLNSANFSGADLGGANLEKANLEGANLSGADLDGAILKGANLKEANLSSTIYA